MLLIGLKTSIKKLTLSHEILPECSNERKYSERLYLSSVLVENSRNEAHPAKVDPDCEKLEKYCRISPSKSVGVLVKGDMADVINGGRGNGKIVCPTPHILDAQNKHHKRV